MSAPKARGDLRAKTREERTRTDPSFSEYLAYLQDAEERGPNPHLSSQYRDRDEERGA